MRYLTRVLDNALFFTDYAMQNFYRYMLTEASNLVDGGRSVDCGRYPCFSGGAIERRHGAQIQKEITEMVDAFWRSESRIE